MCNIFQWEYPAPKPKGAFLLNLFSPATGAFMPHPFAVNSFAKAIIIMNPRIVASWNFIFVVGLLIR